MSDQPINMTVLLVAFTGLALMCACVGGMVIGVILLAEGA